jgi:hypothetical protein
MGGFCLVVARAARSVLALPKSFVTLVTAGLLLALAVGARADEQAAYRQMIEQQKTQQEGYIKRLDPLPGGKQKIEDMVGVKMVDGKLSITSPLFEAEKAAKLRNKQFRAEVEGFEGFCTIMVQQAGNNTHYFTFSNLNYPKLEGISNLTISMQPGYLQISRNYNSRTRNANISLVQSQGRGIYGQPDGVQMSVYGGDNTGRSTVSVNLSEPDFQTLRRKHARTVNEHLRPLLRELKLEKLFAVDAVTAWQVFAADWKGNATVDERVRALLPGLDVDGYDRRDKARQAIKDLGPDGAMVVYRMDRSGLSAEQNCQLDAVLGSQSFLSRKEADRLIGDVDFLLDCLYSADADVREVALKHLRAKAQKEIAFDVNADYEARASQVEGLRAQLSPGKPTTKPATTKPTKG